MTILTTGTAIYLKILLTIYEHKLERIY